MCKILCLFTFHPTKNLPKRQKIVHILEDPGMVTSCLLSFFLVHFRNGLWGTPPLSASSQKLPPGPFQTCADQQGRVHIRGFRGGHPIAMVFFCKSRQGGSGVPQKCPKQLQL